MKPLLAIFLSLTAANAGDLTLLDAGKTDCQIVLLDAAPTPAIDASLQQTARLLQTAFLANKAEIAVVREKERDGSKPALMLGNTVLARKNGVEVMKLRDWSYVQRVVGRDVILAGNDQASKAKVENARRPNWDRVGTAKAAVDFAREFLGVRFLYPDLPGYTLVSGAAKIDVMASPAIMHCPVRRRIVRYGHHRSAVRAWMIGACSARSRLSRGFVKKRRQAIMGLIVCGSHAQALHCCPSSSRCCHA